MYHTTMDAVPTQTFADATALAEAALRLADTALEGALDELRPLASDRDVVVQAADRLRRAGGTAPRERARQHLAFSLVTQLFDREIRRVAEAG
jgi:hypothetical protein